VANGATNIPQKACAPSQDGESGTIPVGKAFMRLKKLRKELIEKERQGSLTEEDNNKQTMIAKYLTFQESGTVIPTNNATDTFNNMHSHEVTKSDENESFDVADDEEELTFRNEDTMPIDDSKATSTTTSTYRKRISTRGTRMKDGKATQDEQIIDADADENTYIMDKDKYLHDFGTEKKTPFEKLDELVAACTKDYAAKKEYVAMYYDDSTDDVMKQVHLKWIDVMHYKTNDMVRASLVDGYLRLLGNSGKYKNTYFMETEFGDIIQRPEARVSSSDNITMRKMLEKGFDGMNILIPLNWERNHWTALHIHLPTYKIISYDSMPKKETWKKVENVVKVLIPLLPEPPKDNISKWNLINTDEDDYIRQYDSVSCGILMLWYITKVASTEKKLLTLEDWDSTNKKATIHKCRQLYESVLLSVVGGHLRMPHSLN